MIFSSMAVAHWHILGWDSKPDGWRFETKLTLRQLPMKNMRGMLMALAAKTNGLEPDEIIGSFQRANTKGSNKLL
jgi:hypothetical protein